MPRGVKRQTEVAEVSAEEDPASKKNRINENLLRFEQMKKEAEENRRRVRDEYLRQQELIKINGGPIDEGDAGVGTGTDDAAPRRETIAAVSGSRTPTNRRKSTSSVEPKSRTPKAKQAKSPVEKKSASKSKDTASPKPRKSPAKEKSEKKVTPKAKSASKTESKKSEAKKSTPAVAVETAPIVLTHMSSEEDEARTEMESDADWCGELYPSIAMSDSVNAIGHLYAGFVAANNGHIIASLGFISVWLAAIVGVMRFGISEKLFAQANSDLANLASNIGYPLIGLSYAAQNFTEINLDTSMIVWVGVVLVFWEALTRSFLDKNRDNAKLLVNIVFFVAPVAASCRASQDYTTLGALIAFVLAGIVITPHHDNRILGVRCVDWFHYIIGVTAIFFANGLGKIQF